MPSNPNIESSSKSAAVITDSGNKGDMFDPFGMAASNAESITSSKYGGNQSGSDQKKTAKFGKIGGKNKFGSGNKSDKKQPIKMP